MAAKPRETYDIAETAAKWGAALDKLRAEQKPGVKSGRGGKAAVLRAVSDRLQALAGEGYTTGQLADALREVSPRMVRAALREAARESTAGKKGRQRKSPQGTRAGTAGSGDSQTAPNRVMPAAARSDVLTPGTPSAHTGAASATDAGTDTDAAAPATGTAAVPFTDGQRVEFRIPEWADGSDLRPGEDLAYYARRKRAAGRPKTPDELKKFIGES